MSKSDKFTLAITALGTAVVFLTGGPLWGFVFLIIGVVFLVSYIHHSENRPDGVLSIYSALETVSLSDTQKSDKLSGHDPRIIPSFVEGDVTSDTPLVQDDKIVLTNSGGTDAFDVQIREIDTGLTRTRFCLIPLISRRQSTTVLPNLYGTITEDGNPREVKIPFHDLIAYCEDAITRGAKPTWEGIITYRDYSDNWFQTKFVLSYHPRAEEIDVTGEFCTRANVRETGTRGAEAWQGRSTVQNRSSPCCDRSKSN